MPQFRKRYPNPTSALVRSWFVTLERCKLPETAKAVEDWAKRHGVYDLANEAIQKRKLLLAKEKENG